MAVSSGQHQHLAGSGQAVDAHGAEHLALGLGHKAVARSGDQVHGLHRLGAKGQGRDGLGAAHAIDLVRPSDVHGHQHGGVDHVKAVEGRGAGRHFLHPGHLGGDDAHQGGAGQGVPPGGDITAHPLDGYHAVADLQAGDLALDVQVLQTGALLLGKEADLVGGEADGLQRGLVHLVIGGLHQLRVHPDGLDVHLVELGGILDQGLVPVLPDVVQNVHHSTGQVLVPLIGLLLRLLDDFHGSHSFILYCSEGGLFPRPPGFLSLGSLATV